MKLSRFYILIISCLFSLTVRAQSVSEIVSFANTQFESENFAIAVKEYNRALFFGAEKVDEVSMQIAHCYTELANYQLAEDFYDQAYRHSQSDSLKNEAILGKSYCLLLENKNLAALSELIYFNNETNLDQQIQSHFLNGIAYYALKNDSLALEEFSTVLELSETTDSVKALLNSEFKKVFRYQKRYNPMRTYIMSGIVPGSGQLSVGAVKEGINSMVLIAGLYIVAAQIIINYSLVDAALSLFPWIQRYYMGGMDKAKGLAVSKIESKRYESYEKIIDITSPNSYK